MGSDAQHAQSIDGEGSAAAGAFRRASRPKRECSVPHLQRQPQHLQAAGVFPVRRGKITTRPQLHPEPLTVLRGRIAKIDLPPPGAEQSFVYRF